MRGRNIIFTGLQPWDISIGSNAKDIALEMSKHNRVLYVNTPFVKWSREMNSNNPNLAHRLSVLRKKISSVRRINANLWVLDFPFAIYPVNKLPDGFVFDFVNRINNKLIFRYIRTVASDLNFTNYLHFIDNDIYRSFYAKELFGAEGSIYYLRDNLQEVDFWKNHAPRLEPKLIQKSDLVFSNSAYLAANARRYNSNSFDVGQGLDLSIYNNHEYAVPEDIASIAHPIVGYTGAITVLRLNPDVIRHLAQNNPLCSFVLVGSPDATFISHPLNELSNVYFLGQRPPETIPNYISAFDICINPQIVNATTIGNYPRKIDEYLALGKPIIATRTETMKIFERYVCLCDTLDEYNDALRAILQSDYEKEKKERKEFANAHTWEACVDKMYNLIGQYLHENREL